MRKRMRNAPRRHHGFGAAWPAVLLAAAISLSACRHGGRTPGNSGTVPGAAKGVAAAPAAGGRSLTPFSGVTFKAELGVRFGAALANILTRQDRYSIDSFKASATATPGALWWDWPGDQIGRMLSVLHTAQGDGWTPAAKRRAAIGDGVLPLQTRYGNFGREIPPETKDARVISGNAFALRGLMDAYEDTRDVRYLEAARRLGRYYEASFDLWRDNGQGLLHEFYGHCLDGLVKLFAFGGDRWALDLAKRAAALAGRTHHAHHSLSMYRGVIDLYEVTGDAPLLDRVADYLGWCRENRVASGGLPEEMPKSYEDEGCAEADYVVANLMMFRATGNDAYLDDAEQTLVNHFFMNQFRTGGFVHRLYDADIIGGKGWQGWEGRFGSENPGCCSFWGAWALGQVGRYIVTKDAGGNIEVNLYPCALVDLPELGTRIEIESDFPRMSRAALTVHCDKPMRRTLSLRVPAWAEGAVAKIGGRTVGGGTRQGRIVLDRTWRSGDRVDIAFTGGLRLVAWPERTAMSKAAQGAGAVGADVSPEYGEAVAEGSGVAAAPEAASLMFSVYDGPLCLALSNGDVDVDAFDRLVVSAAPARSGTASRELGLKDGDSPAGAAGRRGKDGAAERNRRRGADAQNGPMAWCLVLSSDGKPQAVNAEGEIVNAFRPIAEDWLAPDVSNPHRLRILFGVGPKQHKDK
jgi:hypothetical protein